MSADVNSKTAVSDMVLMEVMAKSLHNVFENFQYEVNTRLRNKSDQEISKSLEIYLYNIKDVFVESFNNLSCYLESPDNVDDSFDMFFFSAYIFELFFAIYYSRDEEISSNIFKWYSKYGIRDSTSQIIAKLTEASDKYLDLEESRKEKIEGNNLISEYESVENNLGKLLTRTLLLKDIDLFASSLWNLFPNNKYIISLTNILSQNSKELNPNNRRLNELLINLKEKLPLVVQISIEGLMGNGDVIQACSESWLEAFIFSSMYVPGISLDNFPQFLSIYLECLEIKKSGNFLDRKVENSIVNREPEDMLEHELGALYLLSRDLNKFIVHVYNSPHLYGPFLMTHLFDHFFYEGLLEDVPLEYKSKKLRSHVIMNYALWLIETDLCDPAIYLQECSDSIELLDETSKALTLISNKIPFLYEQISDLLEIDLNTKFVEECLKCGNFILSELDFDWNLDESISVFLKLIREFIFQILNQKDHQLDISRKLIVERYNQLNIEFKKSFNNPISYKLILVYLEKLILLLELSYMDSFYNADSVLSTNYSFWIILEHFLNVSPCSFLNINSGADQFSQYNFQNSLPQEYVIENDEFTDIPIDEQIRFTLVFFSRKDIVEIIPRLFPKIFGNNKEVNFPVFFSTLLNFSRYIDPILYLIITPKWNKNQGIWNSDKELNKQSFEVLDLKKKICEKCLVDNSQSNEDIVKDALETLLSINPNSVPQQIVSLYSLYCLKLIESNLLVEYFGFDAIIQLFNSWMDVLFANNIGDITHPFINDANLRSSIILKISDKINRSFY